MMNFALTAVALGALVTTTYQPSPWRIEAGPILFAGGRDLATPLGFGGTLSVHYAVGAQRLFFFGGRLALLGGSSFGVSGFGGIADADIGLRPRLATWRTGAFALAFAGGVGAAFVGSGDLTQLKGTEAFFHLAFRLGPSVDLGAFTFDALVGPGLLAASGGAVGAIESVLDVGVRF